MGRVRLRIREFAAEKKVQCQLAVIFTDCIATEKWRQLGSPRLNSRHY